MHRHAAPVRGRHPMARRMDERRAAAGRGSVRTISQENDLHPVRSARACARLRGTWQDYYAKWWMLTREHLPSELVELVPSLAKLAPPATIFDKRTYSPWIEGSLHAALVHEEVETLVITGGETDVCVLAAVLGAIDLGYRVVLLSDGVCSGEDGTHDASLKLLGDRFSVQLDLQTTEEFLRNVIV